MRCLAGLPEPEEGREDESRWPYVEIRVLLTEPDPTFRHRVEEALVGKAVRLTSIVPSYPRREGEAEERALSYNDLQKIGYAEAYVCREIRRRVARGDRDIV